MEKNRGASRWTISRRIAEKERCIRSLNASAPESLPSSSPVHEHENYERGSDFLDPEIFEQLMPKRGRPAGAKDMKPRQRRKHPANRSDAFDQSEAVTDASGSNFSKVLYIVTFIGNLIGWLLRMCLRTRQSLPL